MKYDKFVQSAKTQKENDIFSLNETLLRLEDEKNGSKSIPTSSEEASETKDTGKDECSETEDLYLFDGDKVEKSSKLVFEDIFLTTDTVFTVAPTRSQEFLFEDQKQEILNAWRPSSFQHLWRCYINTVTTNTANCVACVETGKKKTVCTLTHPTKLKL